jgi:competence protein ComEC
LGLLLFLTGWTNACWHAAIVSPHDLRLLLAGGPQKIVSLRGVLVAPPSQRIYERERGEIWRSSALIEAREIRTNDAWQPAVGRVVAGVADFLPANIFEGQEVEVTGVIGPPHGPMAAGMFNPRAFYKREGVFFQMRTSTTNDWKAAAEGDAARGPISERFRQWARKTLALGLPGEDEALRLTWTLLLDWKAPLTGSVEEPFLRAGTYHIFAVDGLRIGLLAGIGLGLLRLVRLPRAFCGVLVLPMIWFYAGLTGWPASAVRATIMITVVIAGWACRRPGDLVNSLFAAAIIVLLWDPAQLFKPGFQLSFLVVLCIAVILPRVRQWLRGWLFKGDPFLPDSLQSRGFGYLQTPAGFAVDTAAVSFAAWVGSIPLAAYYFHLFTPVSLPANCVVVPATGLALISAVGSLLTGGWLPGLAGLFNNATWALMRFIISFSGWAAKWPWGNFNAAAPSLSVCAFYYAVLLLVATGWIFRSRHKRAGAAALLAAGLGLAAHWAWGLRAARLDVLALNGAPVILAEAPGLEGKLLIDCGNEESAREVLTPFLCGRGVNRLAGLCLADGRLGFFGGAKIILTNFSPAGIFTGAAQDRSAAYRELMGDLRQMSGWRAVKDGDTIAGWTVLHPGAADQFPQADDNAVALERQLNGQSVLLLPALGREGQEALMRHHPEMRADIVVAGLPAGEEPLCEPLLDLLRPGLIVIADAKFPANRRAPEQLRQRLGQRPARVVYVGQSGVLTLEVGRNGWSLRTADGEPVMEAQPAQAGESPP